MQNWRKILGLLAMHIVIFLAIWRGEQITSQAHWYAITPPLTAVTLALLTHRLLLSLGLGILVGGFLATVPGHAASVSAWGRGLLSGPGYVLSAVTDAINLQILAFVLLVLTMISILIVAGGLLGVVNRLARHARGPRSTQLVTALMGLAIFIDDYANTMIVGSSMRPMTDRHRVSREKLAFLVDATSAPVAGVAVVSTWIGYEVGLFGEVSRSLGIGLDGYHMFFDALAFRFYCFMMILFVLINVISGRDWGNMHAAQVRARDTGELAAPGARPVTSRSFSAASPDKRARVLARTALIPLIGLFLFLLGALWFDGGGLAEIEQDALRVLNPHVWRDVLAQSENNILFLAVASAFGLLLALITARGYAGLSWSLIGRTALGGCRASLLPMAILLLAWSLKGTCDALQTGVFLVDAVGEVLSPLWFPALLFVIAGLTAIATGTSWGTMAILIPTGIPIAYQLDGGSYGLATMMSLGAVLDGAILGDHCSPISDTTIMSSISSSCDHIHHVRTQIPYSLTVGALAIVCGYVPAALGMPSWAGLLGAGVIMVVMFGVFGKRRDGA